MSKFVKIISCFVLVILILSGLPSSALDALTEIESLFTYNVRISDYRINEYTQALPENGVFYDNEARLLYIDELSFPYPPEVQYAYKTRFSDDNLLMIEVSEALPDIGDFTHRSRTWIWFFNPATEDFSPFIPLCGEPRDFSFADFDNPWIYVTDSHTNQVHLCDPTTGRESQALPENLSWEFEPAFDFLNFPIFHSTDGTWLLLFGMHDAQIDMQDEQAYIFSYEIASNHLISLGSFPCYICMEFGTVEWFDTTVNIWTYSSISNEHKIYSANVTRTESLQLAVTRPLYIPEFYDNPPRYDYVNFTTPENIWETQCQHVIYDILSQEIEITELGFLCRPEWGSLDGIGYYRDVSRGAEGIAVLTRFDAATGESEALFEGEIEGIDRISADGQFAVLVLDNNGLIDTPPFRNPFSYWCCISNPRLAYVNLSSDEVLFDIRTGWGACDGSHGGPDFGWSDGLSDTSLTPCSNIGPTGAIFSRDDGNFLPT